MDVIVYTIFKFKIVGDYMMMKYRKNNVCDVTEYELFFSNNINRNKINQ